MPDWNEFGNLYSTPFERIPDDLLVEWWAKYRGKKSGEARLKKASKDPKSIAKREAARVYRETGVWPSKKKAKK